MSCSGEDIWILQRERGERGGEMEREERVGERGRGGREREMMVKM